MKSSQTKHYRDADAAASRSSGEVRDEPEVAGRDSIQRQINSSTESLPGPIARIVSAEAA